MNEECVGVCGSVCGSVCGLAESVGWLFVSWLCCGGRHAAGPGVHSGHINPHME